jgi:hypothetical protein
MHPTALELILAEQGSDALIFRWLFLKRFKRAFGAYIPEHQINERFAGLTEWDCFKTLLPAPLRRLLFKPTMSEQEALAEIVRLSREVLNQPSSTHSKGRDH